MTLPIIDSFDYQSVSSVYHCSDLLVLFTQESLDLRKVRKYVVDCKRDLIF